MNKSDQIIAAGRQETAEQEKLYAASSWTLMRRKFFKHKLALVGLTGLAVLYLGAAFAGFFSVWGTFQRSSDHVFAPPTRVRIFHDGRLVRPFVYGLVPGRDPETLRKLFEINESQVYPIRLFVRGEEEYKLLGLFPARTRLFGVDEPGKLYLFGADHLGRDVYSRILAGARVSLSVGLVGVALSFVIGAILGGISGFFGGTVDLLIQRLIEFLQSLPQIPLWMALAAAVPPRFPPVRLYFLVTVILSIVSWTELARVVRSKIIQLREEDYVVAARIAAANERRIITRHLLPGLMSYLIVSLTLAVPSMILGETALSFIGVGLRPPVVSWGVLLNQAQNFRAVALHPWLLMPGLFVVVTVLLFNFMGDGLRDAADPYR